MSGIEITIAKKAGFCFGVRRAIDMAYKTKTESGGLPVYTLGPLVHNPQVISRLEQDNIKSIDDLQIHPKGHLLIRTHGVSPDIREDAGKLGYGIIDATCPLVKKIHDIVLMLKSQNYPVMIIGHSRHPEVIGIFGEVGENARVIESVEEARSLPFFEKIGIVVQTTALVPKFEAISLELLKKGKEVRIFNTICYATIERQSAAFQLAEKSDLMIVVGGRESSNTRRLLEICIEQNPNSHLVENESEINKDWFRGVKKAGLTAGASTPDDIIDKVFNTMKTIGDA